MTSHRKTNPPSSAAASVEEILYDPVHLGGVILVCLAFLGVLYWDLWALLVCRGGIFSKIGPAAAVVFTSKALKDFGYEGYPHQLGIFEGWIVNLGALVVLLGILSAGVWVFKMSGKKTP